MLGDSWYDYKKPFRLDAGNAPNTLHRSMTLNDNGFIVFGLPSWPQTRTQHRNFVPFDQIPMVRRIILHTYREFTILSDSHDGQDGATS